MRDRLRKPLHSRSSRSGAAGFTLTEMLVAIALAMTFMAALYTGFNSVLTTSNESEARVEAVRNARNAHMTLVDEFKAIRASGSEILLIGVNNAAAFGDGRDNDRDGRTDEEIVDGRDDDGDYNPTADDNHARIDGVPAFYDRYTAASQDFFGTIYSGPYDDLGDFHVDEDVVFGRDSIVFRLFPDESSPEFESRTITYAVGAFEDVPNVLIRQVRTDFADAPSVISTAPLAFGVLGLDLLYWDPNANPQPGTARENRPYWVETWDSTNVANFDLPRFALPASIYVQLTVYADPAPIETYRPGAPVETLVLPNVVNMEEVIDSVLYPRPILLLPETPPIPPI
jgi:prepilin-type N-terminal cleavage/methylation domain-containing protein